eukprot:PITA_09850
MFLALKAFVEKQYGHQILKLRSDNGGEYVNNKFINFCTEHGIQMQHIVPYTPQQNGIAERKNHTLKEMTNCMLQFKGISLNFWAEAINCENYIVNRTPTKVLMNIAPEEAWSSIKPYVSHFRVFGSEAWAHIPDEKHKALKPKSEKCIFVGYFEDVKGYRILPPKSKNVIIRRDVKFFENISAYEPILVDVPPLSIPSTSENISSSDGDSKDENPPPPSQDPPSAPQLPKWVCVTQDAVGALAEALGHPDWDVAMHEEYCSLLANDTWDLVPLPKRRKLVRCKWVYRTKFGPDGKFDKHKAHLVARGFSQVEGIDYTETFSPVAKMNSIGLVLSRVASFKWEVHQMDVKSAFLHEEIYMEQPSVFIQIDSNLVCRLKKSLYGLKQDPWAWYAKMDSFLLDTSFSKCHSDNIVYTKKVGKSLIIIVLYVDDIIFTGNDPNLITHMKSSLKKKFEMTDLGHLHYFLGLQVLQSKEGISLSQSKYKSTTGYVFTLGSEPITWACKKQSVISLSSTEVEYHGVIEASKEALWLCQILSEFGFQQQHLTTLWCDNQSVIQLCKDPIQYQRNKHIELHMNFIKKLIHEHVLEVQLFNR